MQIAMILFFVLFGAIGMYAAMRGQRSVELWLVLPPVLIALALGIGRWQVADPATGLLLWGMLMVFASSAAGALIGMGVGRMIQGRGART